jgi:hypothetical protein
MLVTTENIQELLANIPLDQAQDLHPGCETWPIAPLGKPTGQITVWPEANIAAVSWGYGSFWGRWYGDDRVIQLDDKIEGHTLVVDQAGVLWASLAAEEFKDRMVENFIRHWDVTGLTRVAEGRDPQALEVTVGCSVLPIFQGREMTLALLAALAEENGPFERFRPVLH